MTKISKSKGLGDTIHKIITATGAEILVQKIKKGKGCVPCQKRREALNKKFPYRK